MEIVLTIAGSDPCAGAGIQQDLKTITAHRCYGATVITALTSQNTMGVRSVMPVPATVVKSQLESVLDDLDVRAVKIGQIPNRETAHAIVEVLRNINVPIVYDPVMISTSGRRLMSADTVDVIVSELFPLCTLITPNIPEAECLIGGTITSDDEIVKAGETLVARFNVNVLLKGGHAERDNMVDRLFMTDGSMVAHTSERIATRNLHGTGCTLSSAIASSLALGLTLREAVSNGKDFVSKAISRGRELCIGHGNGPLDVFLRD